MTLLEGEIPDKASARAQDWDRKEPGIRGDRRCRVLGGSVFTSTARELKNRFSDCACLHLRERFFQLLAQSPMPATTRRGTGRSWELGAHPSVQRGGRDLTTWTLSSALQGTGCRKLELKVELGVSHRLSDGKWVGASSLGHGDLKGQAGQRRESGR